MSGPLTGSDRRSPSRRWLAEPAPARMSRQAAVTDLLVVLVVAAVTLLWAKWLPYVARAQGLGDSGHGGD